MNIVFTLGILSALFVACFTALAYLATDQGAGQTRRQSIIEAWANIAIGFSINYTANLVLLPLVGARFTLAENFWLGWIYTAISILRQYAIRRWFNDRIHAVAAMLAGRE
jgi:hypothetical protein